MTASMIEFRQAAAASIADPLRQSALEGATHKFAAGRLAMLAELPDPDALRDHFKAIRSATLARLAHHLETFERNATAAGAQIHWAADGDAACRIVAEIARRHGVTVAVKSKSMATEEIHLNAALQAAGIEPIETDLGEWIIQQSDEPPFHIIAPAIHKTRGQVADLINTITGQSLDADDIPGMTATARRLLREQFLTAGMGISGGNLAVAETGSVVLVTNEGNGRMVTSLPPVHVAVIGIEKIAPTWDDAAAWLTLLARSATGQPMSIYTTAITGPARPGDTDGPREVHVVLLDNGRSRQIGTPFEESLQCIRCSACLNVCPVYREAGGHAYGNPYSGPIGAVISPLFFGLEKYEALPHASSLCIACRDACPVRIDLPRMLLELRNREVEERVLPWPERLAEQTVTFGFRHRRLYAVGTALARFGQKPVVKGRELSPPQRFNPAAPRRLPALAPRSFRELWKSGELDTDG